MGYVVRVDLTTGDEQNLIFVNWNKDLELNDYQNKLYSAAETVATRLSQLLGVNCQFQGEAMDGPNQILVFHLIGEFDTDSVVRGLNEKKAQIHQLAKWLDVFMPGIFISVGFGEYGITPEEMETKALFFKWSSFPAEELTEMALLLNFEGPLN